MNKNTSKIKAGIRALTSAPNEIISGTVITGSVDTSAYTVSVLPGDSSEAIEGVLLSAVAENGNGIIIFPKEESNVVIGCIDGPGEWVLIKASDIAKVIITIANVKCEIDDTQISVQNGDVLFNISSSVFKMNTASESLFQLLKDCFTYLTVLTVPTPSGTSGVPVNVTDFTNLITRLNNLLSS